MRVTPEHLAMLASVITPEDTEYRRAAYRERRIPRADGVQDIDTRYRWDLYWYATTPRYAVASRVSDRLQHIVRDANGDDVIVNPTARPIRDAMRDGDYLTTHIDTALRRIVPAL